MFKQHHSVKTMNRFLLVSFSFVPLSNSYSIFLTFFRFYLTIQSELTGSPACVYSCENVRVDSDDAAGAAGVAPADERHGVVEGHG